MSSEALSSALVQAVRALADVIWWDGFLRGIALGALAGLALAAIAGATLVAVVFLVLCLRTPNS